MARLRLILVSYGFLYLEKNFDFYDFTLQRSLLHFLPALFNYCSMRELVILLVF